MSLGALYQDQPYGVTQLEQSRVPLGFLTPLDLWCSRLFEYTAGAVVKVSPT